MKRNIMIEEFYPFPPEQLWKALTNSRALAEWLMPNDFEPRVGHCFRFRDDPSRAGTASLTVKYLKLTNRSVFPTLGKADQ